jgi:hypothetical protein
MLGPNDAIFNPKCKSVLFSGLQRVYHVYAVTLIESGQALMSYDSIKLR